MVRQPLSRAGPGADVGWYEPSPVVSDERSSEAQMRAYRGEPYQAHTALRTDCAATDDAACDCRWSDAAGRCIAAGCAAMQPVPLVRSGPPTLAVLKGHSRGALGRCNRLRWDATGNNAAIQQDEQCCGGRRTPGCAHVCADGPNVQQALVGMLGLTKRECAGVGSAQAGASAPKWERASEWPCCPAAAMRALPLPSVAQACV